MVIRDDSIGEDTHDHMITQMMGNNSYLGESVDLEESALGARLPVVYNRDFWSSIAKINKKEIDKAKRQKVLNYMGRWDEWRVRREQVVSALVKQLR